MDNSDDFSNLRAELRPIAAQEVDWLRTWETLNDQYIQDVHTRFSAKDAADIDQAVIGSSQYKELKPKLALEYLSNNLENIHDKREPGGVTAAEINKYIDQCHPNAIYENALRWFTTDISQKGGQFKTRLDYMENATDSKDGLTNKSLNEVYNIIQTTSEQYSPNREIKDELETVDFLNQHMGSPWFTKAHPNGLTEFSLNQMSNSVDLSLAERAKAEEAGRQLPRIVFEELHSTDFQVTAPQAKSLQVELQKKLDASKKNYDEKVKARNTYLTAD